MDLSNTHSRAMNGVIRPTRSAWLTFDEIEVSDNARPYNASDVVTLAKSIREIGLLTPLTVVERDGRFVLVAGRHRLEALRVIGTEKAPCRIVDMTDIEARLWTISENLHRTELTVSQRANQIAEWVRLTAEKVAQVAPPLGGEQPADKGIRAATRELGIDRREAQTAEKVSVQVEQKPRGGRPESGIAKASRDLGIDRSEVNRSIKIASITPAAKEAACEAGLDDNQSALLRVASAPAATQVETVAKIVQSRAQPAAKASHDLSTPPSLAPMRDGARPLRDLINISGGELARWIKITTPNDRPHVVRVLRMAADILEDELEGEPGVAAQ